MKPQRIIGIALVTLSIASIAACDSLPKCSDVAREVTVYSGTLDNYGGKPLEVRQFRNSKESQAFSSSLMMKNGRPNFVTVDDRPLQACNPR